MAQEKYLIELKKAEFPLLSELLTRTTIAQAAASGDAVPQLLYAENVLPIQRGIESIQYVEIIPPIEDRPSDIVDVRIIYGSKRGRYYLAFCACGSYYILNQSDPNNPFWELKFSNQGGDPFDPEKLTTGTVNGVTYIHFRGSAEITIYDEDTGTFVPQTVLGIDPETWDLILGIVASSGYLIVYTANAIRWSSTINPVDFVPDPVTGSGGGDISDIAGAILFSVPNTLGMIFYTDANAVAASYTGNVQYPFKLREVENSKGGIGLDLIAYEANSDPQYVFSKAGFQTINSREAETVLPELTDFLTGRRVEYYDYDKGFLVQQDLTSDQEMVKKVKYINSRYIGISYGIDEFTNTIVYDTALKRMGKLAIDHTDLFEYSSDSPEIAGQIATFLLADGSCISARSTSDPTEELDIPAIAIIGNIQSRHTRMTTLLEAELEIIPINGSYGASDDFQCSAISAVDGASDGGNPLVTQGRELYSAAGIQRIGYNVTAKNHNLVIDGAFSLTTALIIYKIHGRR